MIKMCQKRTKTGIFEKKFGIRRKISVADFLYRGDLSESKIVFCGGNFSQAGNTDVGYNL
jgi:hypothetical protein